MVSYLLFLFALLAYAIASEAGGKSSNSLPTEALTATQATTSTEPEIPPAEWPTKFVSDYVSPLVTITSTIPTTKTRTVSGHVTVVPDHTGGADTLVSCHTTCSSWSVFHGPSSTFTCHKTQTVVTTVYTITTQDCGYEPETSGSVRTTSSTPVYSCDPRVNLSCLSSLRTSSTTTSASSRSIISTNTVDPVSHSTTPCQQASSTLSFKTSTSRSTFSASPESLSGSGQSSSITTCSSIHSTTSASVSYHPTSSSSSSPVTAGSNALRPNMKIQVLAAPVVFAFVLCFGIM